MKKIINYKRIVLFAATLLLVLGCNINAIPTYVSKDVSFGVLTVNNLQDKSRYVQELVIDLSKFISDDEFNAIETAKLKSIILTLNGDYKNSVTNSKDIEQGAITLIKLKEGVPLLVNSSGTILNYSIDDVFSFSQTGLKNGVAKKFLIMKNFNIKDIIKNKKVRIGIILFTQNNSNFNDNSFSFTGKVETEVLVVQ